MRIAAVNSVRAVGGGEKWLVRQAGCWQAAGDLPLVICQPGAGLERLAAEAGLPCAPVRLRHDLSLPSVLRLAACLRRFRPEVLLCCTERAFRLAVPASLLAGSPAVVVRNGLTGTFKNKAVNWLLFRRAARMVVNAGALQAEMESFGWIPPARLRVIRNGIDPAPYAPDPAARQRVRAELGTPPEALVVGVLARLAPDKGQAETVAAVAALTPRYPGLELWLAGEGSPREALEAQARRLGVRARFLGYREDVPALLQAVDLVALASHREGLSNTVLEALAAGRPVVATAVGGVPEVLDAAAGKLPGILVPPHDPEALQAALDALLSDPERRRRAGEAGRRRVAEAFALEGEARQWRQLFAEVAAEQPGRKGS